MSGRLAFVVSCINIPRKVGPDGWAECLRRAQSGASIVGVQECFTDRQWAEYRTAGWGRIGEPSLTSNPILWDRAVWVLVRHRVVDLHAGGTGPLARRFPGYNAGRTALVAVLEHRESRERVTVINTHLVAYGPKVPGAWRAWALARSLVRLRRLVRAAHRRGQAVVPMGDLNSEAPLPIGVRWLRPAGTRGRSIDRIGVLPPKGWTAAAVAKRFRAPTDHRYGVHADLTIIFKEAP